MSTPTDVRKSALGTKKYFDGMSQSKYYHTRRKHSPQGLNVNIFAGDNTHRFTQEPDTHSHYLQCCHFVGHIRNHFPRSMVYLQCPYCAEPTYFCSQCVRPGSRDNIPCETCEPAIDRKIIPFSPSVDLGEDVEISDN